MWVEEQTVESLIEAVRRFEMLSFDTERLVKHAGKFSTERFQRELRAIIDRELERAGQE